MLYIYITIALYLLLGFFFSPFIVTLIDGKLNPKLGLFMGLIWPLGLCCVIPFMLIELGDRLGRFMNRFFKE